MPGVHYYVHEFTELRYQQTGDAFPMNPTQWNDTDADGWGDNYNNASWTAERPVDDQSTQDVEESWPGLYMEESTKVDKFPLFRYQWAASDGDWIGDEPNTPLSDGCPNTWGNSTEDRIGCEDTDGDGYGDEQTGFQPDSCPERGGEGTSWGDRFGCNGTWKGTTNLRFGWFSFI